MSTEAGDMTGFLTELTMLTRKYGISINGCGCCGSPYLYAEAGPNEDQGFYHLDSGGTENLTWESGRDRPVVLQPFPPAPEVVRPVPTYGSYQSDTMALMEKAGSVAEYMRLREEQAKQAAHVAKFQAEQAADVEAIERAAQEETP